jgi:predicted nucleic acid-binding protein
MVSIQVLEELTLVASRKLKIKWAEISEVLATIRTVCEVIPVTVEIHETGMAIAARYDLSFASKKLRFL